MHITITCMNMSSHACHINIPVLMDPSRQCGQGHLPPRQLETECSPSQFQGGVAPPTARGVSWVGGAPDNHSDQSGEGYSSAVLFLLPWREPSAQREPETGRVPQQLPDQSLSGRDCQGDSSSGGSLAPGGGGAREEGGGRREKEEEGRGNLLSRPHTHKCTHLLIGAAVAEILQTSSSFRL